MSIQLYETVSLQCSKLTTKSYSTSFSLGIRFLDKKLHNPIYSIYGFVRFADEIVDTFHQHDKKVLLDEFKTDTWKAIDRGISLNPILNSFQETVHKYNIDKELIETFLYSMEMDLSYSFYNQKEFEKYITGSAEVVGLMCLKVFCNGEQKTYDHLKFGAMRLGSAFQKINFLRDLNADYIHLGRAYFPELDVDQFDETTKKQIEADIELDFKHGYEGIQQLPKAARFGVYMAYTYYYRLFKKIKKVPSKRILKERIRIPNQRKYALFLGSYLRHSFNLI
jgi:phytoene synthase